MESFLPVFQRKIEITTPFIESYGFLFREIYDRKNIDKLTSKNCTEYHDAEFERECESVSIQFSYGKDNKLVVSFSYFNSKMTLDFFLNYYAKDHNLPILAEVPIIHSHKEGEMFMNKFFDELKKLLETTLMAKINDGTIDNHYYRFHDQFR